MPVPGTPMAPSTLASPRSGRRDLVLLAAGVASSTAGDAAALTALLLRLRPLGVLGRQVGDTTRLIGG